MSDQKNANGVVRVVPGKPTSEPAYRYQTYEGRSGSASAKRGDTPERQFAELQNFVLR